MIARGQRLLRLFAWCVVASAFGASAPTYAAQSFDDQRGELAARVATQNTFQHHDDHSINWVQWRNEVRFDLKYDLIAPGSGESWGPVKTLRFNMPSAPDGRTAARALPAPPSGRRQISRISAAGLSGGIWQTAALASRGTRSCLRPPPPCRSRAPALAARPHRCRGSPRSVH